MAEYQVGQIYEGLKESDLYILTEFFKMLGNPARIRILLLLMGQGANVRDLAEQPGISRSAVRSRAKSIFIIAVLPEKSTTVNTPSCCGKMNWRPGLLDFYNAAAAGEVGIFLKNFCLVLDIGMANDVQTVPKGPLYVRYLQKGVLQPQD